jgi:hypothetical protein
MSAIHTATPHPSDSRAQREIEAAVLARCERRHPEWKRVQWKEAAAELGLSAVWRATRPDAAWREDSASGPQFIVAECYMRIGPLTAGHLRKMAMDVLKLIAMQRAVSAQCRVHAILIVPEELSKRLSGDRWIIDALRLVEIVSIALLDEERAQLNEATELQAQGQARAGNRRRSRAV